MITRLLSTFLFCAVGLTAIQPQGIRADGLAGDRSSTTKTDEEWCKQLVNYRDGLPLDANGNPTGLVAIYDEAHRNYEQEMKTLHEAIADYRKWRQELKDDNWWSTSNSLQLLIYLDLISGTIKNIFKIASPQGEIIQLLETGDAVFGKLPYSQKDKQRAYLEFTKLLSDVIKRGKLSKQQFDAYLKRSASAEFGGISEQTVAEITCVLLEEAGPKLGRIAAVCDLIVDFRGGLKNAEDFSDNKALVQHYLDQFDKEISAYEAKILSKQTTAITINKYQQYITAYLNEHCGQYFTPDQLKTPAKPVTSKPAGSKEITDKGMAEGKKKKSSGDDWSKVPVAELNSELGFAMIVEERRDSDDSDDDRFYHTRSTSDGTYRERTKDGYSGYFFSFSEDIAEMTAENAFRVVFRVPSIDPGTTYKMDSYASFTFYPGDYGHMTDGSKYSRIHIDGIDEAGNVSGRVTFSAIHVNQHGIRQGDTRFRILEAPFRARPK